MQNWKRHEGVSAYCKKWTGQEPDHDRCYGRSAGYLICTCKCHDKEEGK